MGSAELNYHFVNSAILTALVSLFVLWRYRTAVLDGMMRGDATAVPLPASIRSDGERSTRDLATLLRHERSLRSRIALAYWLTTLSCGVPLAAGYAYLSGWELSPAYILMLTLCYGFACVPMIAVSLALPPLRTLAGLALLVALSTLLAVGAALAQRAFAGRPIGLQHLGMVPFFLQTAAIQLWMPALFWLLTWPSRLRGVAPITFAALLVFGLAPFAGSRLTAALAATEAGTPLVFKLGMSGMFVLIALPAGWLAWERLCRLARDYEAKRFSDAQLLSRTWWLFLVAAIGMEVAIARDRPGAALALCTGVVLAFGPVNGWWLARLRAGLRPLPARTLLLLRVFGYTARTERLFDRIGARWRLFGPVTMIAAPDVAARTIDPGDYLRWLTGRADELFVTSRADLDARLDALDMTRDPDGRYRINEFCCRDNTWQATVVELMQRADAVVMDVRGVTRERRGCEFELQQLALRLPPQRVVLVADRATDRGVLEAAFDSKLDSVQVIKVERTRDTAAVFRTLLAASRY